MLYKHHLKSARDKSDWAAYLVPLELLPVLHQIASMSLDQAPT